MVNNASFKLANFLKRWQAVFRIKKRKYLEKYAVRYVELVYILQMFKVVSTSDVSFFAKGNFGNST